MPLTSFFKKAPVEVPVLLCGFSNEEKGSFASKLRAWFEDESDRKVDGVVLMRPPAIILSQLPMLDGHRIKLYYSHSGKETDSSAPPHGLHQSLQLAGGQGSLLFIHNIDEPNVEESLLCLYRHVSLLYEYGGRGVRVLVYKKGKENRAAQDDDENVVRDLVSRFELELSYRCGQNFHWGVGMVENSDWITHLQQGMSEALVELGQAPVRESRVGKSSGSTSTSELGITKDDEDTGQHRVVVEGEKSSEGFWNDFLNGAIAPWTHRDYIRAIFLTLLQPENKTRGVLEVATDFAEKMNAFKRRPVPFPQKPESRTLTVFWVYHVKLAMDMLEQYLKQNGGAATAHLKVLITPHNFHGVLRAIPHLLDPDLPKIYFSPDILSSRDYEQYWTLPDLHSLTVLPKRHDPGLGKQIIANQPGDPDRLLRFAFAVVHRYLNDDSSRRRSWFIDQGFAAFNQRTIRLRTQHASIPPYSVTQLYFFIQMVHAHLTAHPTLSYPAFRALFPSLTSTAWTRYYTQKTWHSLEARAAFTPPDIQPLPTQTTSIPLFSPPPDFQNTVFIPELPNPDILTFHLSLFLSTASSLPKPLLPSNVTSHPALLLYLHTNLLTPVRATPSQIASHISLLSSATSYSTARIRFWTRKTLHAATTPLPIRRYPSSETATTIFRASYKSPDGKWHRFHNCPCHADLELEAFIGPGAVEYPHQYPYDHLPQLTHGCLCHKGLELDHDAFARVCAEGYETRELWRKQWNGLRAREATMGDDPWENFVRFNPVLVWEGLSEAGCEGEEWEEVLVKGVERWDRGGDIPGKEGGGDDEKVDGKTLAVVEDRDVTGSMVRLSVAETLQDKGEEDEDGWEVVG
ncbi:hypothetical protein OQA88_894 [Cercophora sp. LCS_1]